MYGINEWMMEFIQIVYIITLLIYILNKLYTDQYNSPGLRPRACRILDIIVLFIGFRFSSSWSLDFVSWNWSGATYPRRPRADPAPNYSRRRVADSVGDGYTPRDMSLKIALVFDQFFFVFRSIFWSKMPPKIDPKTFKNQFSNRLRF